MGDMMRPNQDFDIDPEIVRPPENLDDASRRPLILVPKIENLRGDDHAVKIFHGFHFNRACAHAVRRSGFGQGHVFRNLNPLADSIVVRNNEKTAPPDAKLAHHRRMRTPQHPQNLAVCAAVGFDSSDSHHHAVAVHRACSRVLSDVNIASQPGNRNLGSDERETIAVHVQSSGGELTIGTDRYVLAGSCLNDLAALDQRLQFGFDLRTSQTLPRQLTRQLLQSRAAVRQLADIVQKQTIHYIKRAWSSRRFAWKSPKTQTSSWGTATSSRPWKICTRPS